MPKMMNHFLSLILLIALHTSPAFSRLPNFPAKQQNSFGFKTRDLIRELNLFPKRDINIISPLEDSSLAAADADADATASLVEKRLELAVDGSSGATVQDLAHHAGYFRLPHTKAARMFYFLFESRTNKADPVVLWLTGGPGCSGEIAMFYENGPYKITPNFTLVWNDFGWDKVSNLIFVDQPTGTGFSYSSNWDDIRSNSVSSSNDLYDFLQALFKKHPEFVGRDFFITGESYAGHSIPALATRILQGNKKKEGTFINLKGFAIGNGITDPGIQIPAYRDYALEMKIIRKVDYDGLNDTVKNCINAVKPCGTNGVNSCVNASRLCGPILNTIITLNRKINYYDIRKECNFALCYDFSSAEKFLNETSVRKALGVGNIEFVSCSRTVSNAMEEDTMRDYKAGIPAMLESNVRVLIYAGEYDLVGNWLGNSKWLEAMKWSGQKKYVAAPYVPFKVNGVEAGQLKGYGPLKFLRVHNAGHLVPMDQPQAALQMIQRWMKGQPLSQA